MARVVGVSESDDTRIIDDILVTSSKSMSPDSDPFKKHYKEIKGVEDRNLRRRFDRKIEKTCKGKDGATSKQIEVDATGYEFLDVVQPPLNLDWLAKLPEMSGPHFAAIKAKEANVIGLGFSLVDSPKTKMKMDEIDDPEQLAKFRKKLARARQRLQDHLDETNDDDSLIDTLSRVFFDFEAVGVGYLEIGRNANGQIGYIGHIPATTVRVRAKRDGYVQMVSNKAIFFRNFGEDTPNPLGGDENPNELIMFKKYSPSNSFYGVPDIVAATAAIAGNEFAARFNIDYFDNKAVPRHIIVLKGAKLGSAAEQRLAEFFETSMRGVNHRSLYIPLPGDTATEKVSLEVKPVEAGKQDQSFDRYREANNKEILFTHRVPPNKIGLIEGTSVATALDASKTFKEEVCQPLQRMFAKKINKVIKEFTDAFVFEFNELTLTDEETQARIDQIYLTTRVVVPNEVRARKGWAGIEGGDEPIELKAQAKAEQRADAGKTRTEDIEDATSVSRTATDGRNPKGEGRRSGRNN